MAYKFGAKAGTTVTWGKIEIESQFIYNNYLSWDRKGFGLDFSCGVWSFRGLPCWY